MAYNTFYPGPYQPQPQPMPQPPQIQNGGFISVTSIEMAQNWPVAPGNSVTFKDERAPFVYTKTMGFSPLDRPIFEVFRLVKEENAPAPVSAEYALKSDFNALSALVDGLRGELAEFRTKFDSGKEKEE